MTHQRTRPPSHRRAGTLLFALAALIATSYPSIQNPASAQDYCTDDCIDVTIDAGLGVESLEEPVPGQINETAANGYLNVDLASVLQLYNFQAAIQGPLRFDFDNFELREADWDEGEDFLRILNCARIDYMIDGDDELRIPERGGCGSWTPDEAVGAINPVYSDFTYLSLRLHPVYNYSLGYGSIIHGYNAMIEEDHFRDGINLEANINRWIVFTGALSDIVDPTVTAGRLAFRPVQGGSEGAQWDPNRGWVQADSDTDFFVEIGSTVAGDVNAPVNLNPETGLAEPGNEGLVAGGIDARVRWSSENRSSFEDFAVIRFEFGGEYNRLFSFGDGAHAHMRLYYDIGAVDFYVGSEYRFINGQYMPSYFDQHYRVQRTQYTLSDQQRELLGASALTKRDVLAALPDETEHAYAFSTRVRFWTQAFDPSGQGTGYAPLGDLTLFVEDVPDRDVSGRAGAELALYAIGDRLNLTALFVQQGWDDLSGLFSFDNSVLDINGRISLTELVYLNLFYDRTWFVDPLSQLFNSNSDFGLSVGFEALQ